MKETGAMGYDVLAEYLTEKDVSQRYHRALSTLRNDRFLNRGLPYTKLGRRILYRLSDIEQLLERNKVETSDSLPSLQAVT